MLQPKPIMCRVVYSLLIELFEGCKAVIMAQQNKYYELLENFH